MIATLENSPAPAWLYIGIWLFLIAAAWTIAIMAWRSLAADANGERELGLIDHYLCFVIFCVCGAFAVMLPVLMTIDLWPR